MDNTSAIAFNQLKKNFGSLEVLKGVSGHIETGEVIAIIGSSGCGKSTLLRCFNRLEAITSGQLIVDGIDLSQAEIPAKALRYLHQRVGMVFQQFNLFPHLSVLENLTLAPQKVLGLNKGESRDRGQHYLAKVGLSDKAQAYPDQLSGGQKQRVAIARSLCMEPKIMLFDEPTSALDPELVGEVLLVMRQLADEGMTMVVVTHEMQFAQEVASRVFFLNQGQIEEEGPAKQVMTEPESDRLRTFLSRINSANVLC